MNATNLIKTVLATTAIVAATSVRADLNPIDLMGKVDIVSPVYVPTANLFTRFIRRLGLNI